MPWASAVPAGSCARPTEDLAEGKYRFVRYLERTEGKPIPFIGRG